MSAGIIIAAPAAGNGKTVVVLGLLRHLRRQDRSVAAFKVGPDTVDPAFHTAAAGRACVNLDIWAMRRATLDGLIGGLSRTADLVIGEGVMGLYDGVADGGGSTADLAALTGWPVVLVIDAHAMAESAAAVVRGFAGHRADVALVGVIFNRVGGAEHAALLRQACEGAGTVPVLGCIARDPRLAVAARRLGLARSAEEEELELFIDAAADVIGSHIDWPALVAAARPARGEDDAETPVPIPPLGQRIAVADDAAFAFAYPWVLEGWRAAGATVMPFSPLAGETADVEADAIYLPGGYPEDFAGRLAIAAGFLGGLRAAAARGVAIYGERDGYRVLGRGLIDDQGTRHEMAGLIPIETSSAARRLRIGYRKLTLKRDGPLGPAGRRFRGHEFRHCDLVDDAPAPALFDGATAAGRLLPPVGYAEGNVVGSFVQLIDRVDD